MTLPCQRITLVFFLIQEHCLIFITTIPVTQVFQRYLMQPSTKLGFTREQLNTLKNELKVVKMYKTHFPTTVSRRQKINYSLAEKRYHCC